MKHTQLAASALVIAELTKQADAREIFKDLSSRAGGFNAKDYADATAESWRLANKGIQDTTTDVGSDLLKALASGAGNFSAKDYYDGALAGREQGIQGTTMAVGGGAALGAGAGALLGGGIGYATGEGDRKKKLKRALMLAVLGAGGGALGGGAAGLGIMNLQKK